MSEKKKKFEGKAAISRFGLVSYCFLLFFVFILYKICVIKYAEGPEWRKLGDKLISHKEYIVKASRGNIYGEGNKLLASSIPQYKVYLDFNADGINKDTVNKYIDTLSILLAQNFSGKSTFKYNADYYKKRLSEVNNKAAKEAEALKKSKRDNTPKPKLTCRRFLLIPYEIDFIEFTKLRQLPYLKKPSYKTGLYTDKRTERLKPFGYLAGRSIGSIDPDPSIGGRSGMELKYDSILKGNDGLKTMEKVGGTWVDRILKEPTDGKDILVTINVDYQDITEKALYRKMIETKAVSGCAILMEVKTGEIKAISNLDRITEGVYGEGKPNAFSYMFEPGSTFKTVSLLAALDDGIITPDTQIDGASGKIQYATRWIIDHDAHRARDKSAWTVKQGIANSSNVITAKMILKGYEDHPEKYIEKIRKMGLGKNLSWDVPLQGKEGTTNIRSPKDPNVRWSKTALPWMSFGYETQVPPIYLLMFYNAIANNGKMIKPFLFKAILENGKIKKEFKGEVINSSIASSKAIKSTKEILRYVVTDGTGKPVDSDIVKIAGKSGTTKLSENGKYGRNYYVSFAGYFPEDNPKYTIYVGIERPEGPPAGGGMAGAVLREIAEKIIVRESVTNPILPQKDTINQILPRIHNGILSNALLVLDELNLKTKTNLSEDQWVKPTIESKEIIFDTAIRVETEVMPDVKGMGAKDALYILESQGLKVKINGYGKVEEQSIAPGSKINRGATVSIKLNL